MPTKKQLSKMREAENEYPQIRNEVNAGDVKNKRKEVSRQTYKFEIIHYDDGTSDLVRNNDRFSVLELMGIATLVQSDMCQIFKDALKVDNVERNSSNSPLIHKPK